MISEYFITINEKLSEIIPRLKIDHEQIQLKSHNAENQIYTLTNITNTSLEASPTIDTIIHSQHMDSNSNETTETDLFHIIKRGNTILSHAIKTSLLIDFKK